MSIVAKAGLGVAALGGVGIAGCYAMGVFGDTKPVLTATSIAWTSLKEEIATNANGYSGKIGQLYGKYLVGANTASNQKMWEKLYGKYEKDKGVEETKNNLSESFGNTKVTEGYSTTVTTALNKVCDEAYKKEESSVSFDAITTGDSNASNKKLGRDILKYCSVLGQKPEKIGDNGNYGNGKVGDSKKNELVSTTNTNNGGFWEAQQKFFSTLGSSFASNEYFKQFFNEGETKTLKDGNNIKDICEEAYKKEDLTSGSSTNEKPLQSDVVKYCSFKKEGE